MSFRRRELVERRAWRVRDVETCAERPRPAEPRPPWPRRDHGQQPSNCTRLADLEPAPRLEVEQSASSLSITCFRSLTAVRAAPRTSASRPMMLSPTATSWPPCTASWASAGGAVVGYTSVRHGGVRGAGASVHHAVRRRRPPPRKISRNLARRRRRSPPLPPSAAACSPPSSRLLQPPLTRAPLRARSTDKQAKMKNTLNVVRLLRRHDLRRGASGKWVCQ